MEKVSPILCFLILLLSTRGNCQDSSDPGILCDTSEGGNDSLGQHLGCNCNRFLDNDVMLKADCTNRWIGYNDTIILPPQLNISNNVRTVDFTRNMLKSIDKQTFGDCQSVQILLLSDNQINSFTGVNCPRLQKLDLSRNHLKNLTASALDNLPGLTELNLSYNQLLFLEPTVFEQLHNLRILNLASNQLGMELYYGDEYMLSLKNLQHLEELDLSNSTLPDFPQYLIAGTQHLKKLRLRDNLIKFIGSGVFQEMGELTELDLSGNLFDEIVPSQFMGLTSLQVLTLDKMRKLTTVREFAFSGLANLQEISCQMNYFLNHIDSQAFRANPDPDIQNSTDCHPKIVRLGDNDLRYIDYALLSWNTIDILELHRNQWVCDCNLQWVSDFYIHKPKDAAILADSYFSCYEPHIFAGVPVVHVNPEEMLCFSPAATIAGTIGIMIFGIVLLSFCFVIILNQMGMLPDWVRQYNIFGSGNNLPTYMRVNPRPNTKARRMVDTTQALPELHCYNVSSKAGEQGQIENNNTKQKTGQGQDDGPATDDLEWDNADIGRT